ncbi:hypothetical protein LGK95_08140 [Clostridium algoriphilum]|uniref:hypothetical protein n=1 Tax=Clostridium algoriphilum TaxID=198347 RepID=UPI001CF21C16|nr:hypothetical protein [Clostridium algoriphilum]MCB2293489.1 hypothetical protein [Clostridium algoriphilum]
MLATMSVICYGVIGFGIGGISGITFMNKDAKNTIKLFGNSRIDNEDELSQVNRIKEKQQFRVQQLTKENTKLQKQYDNVKKDMELLQMKSTEEQIKIYGSMDNEIEEILNPHEMKNDGQIELFNLKNNKPLKIHKRLIKNYD